MTETVRGALARTSELIRRALVVGYLRRTDRQRAARVVMVEGTPLLTLPQVFPPNSFTTSLVLRNREQLRGLDVLDVGCGAGALEVLTAGLVKSLHATDVSAEAVRTTRLNLAWHEVKHVQVMQSDLLENVQGDFDVIVFNAPFFPGKAQNAAEQQWLGDNGKILERFLQTAPQYLRPRGEIWLTHADIADEPGFHAAMRKADFTWTVMDSRSILIETFKLYRLTRAAEAPRV